MIRHDAVQMGAPDSVRGSARKPGLGGCAAAHEANAAEGIRFAVGDLDAELVQSLNSIRHQSFAARLVDRRNCAVRHHHAQTVTACGNGGGQAGRSTADHEYVPRIRKMAHKFIGQDFKVSRFQSFKTCRDLKHFADFL